jgi:hypothetical protein
MEQSDIILDQLNVQQVFPVVYLKRSLRLLWCYVIELVLILVLAFGENLFENSEVMPMIVGFGAIISFASAPFGLFFSFKSFRRQEGTSRARIWHLIAHVFVLFLLGVIFLAYYFEQRVESQIH